jgi:ribonuclease P protein component
VNEQFGKAYKLCSKKIIGQLFENGQKISVPTFFVRYDLTVLPSPAPFQLVIAVPKKKVKSAPARNRIKRLIREAIRKNKSNLEHVLLTSNQQLALFLIYQDSEKIDYPEVEHKIVLLLERLVKRISEKT